MSKAVLFTAGDTWKIQGDLNFATAFELYESAHEAMQQKLPASVNLEAVERVDSAGVALMLDWIRNTRSSQQKLKFHNVPAHMRSIAELCSVGYLFDA